MISPRDAKLKAHNDLLRFLSKLDIKSADPWWLLSDPVRRIEMLTRMIESDLIGIGEARILLKF